MVQNLQELQIYKKLLDETLGKQISGTTKIYNNVGQIDCLKNGDYAKKSPGIYLSITDN